MHEPVAFLIDADNVSDASAVHEAFAALLSRAGHVAIRHAYGSAENLKGLASVIKDLAIQPHQTFPLSKNTTDAALIVGAMEIACERRPAVIAIASGDLDFFPLAVRLRERGIKTYCFSLANKLHEEVKVAYDECFLVGHAMASMPQTPAAVPVKSQAKKTSAKKVPPVKTVAKKTAAKKVKAAAKANPDVGKITVEQILRLVPALKSGQPQPLSDIAKPLHDAKLLGKNASSPKLFKKFPHHFELMPSKQPNRVRYIPTP